MEKKGAGKKGKGDGDQRKQYKIDYPDARWEMFCVKTGFHSVFKWKHETDKKYPNDENNPKDLSNTNHTRRFPRAPQQHIDAFKTLVDKTVMETSRWTIEAGMLIQFDLYELLESGDEDKINEEFNGDAPPRRYFMKYFQQLQKKPPPSQKGKLNPQYAKIRQMYNLPFYNEKGICNIQIYEAEQFHTNLMVNIQQHSRTHVKRFLRLISDTKPTGTRMTKQERQRLAKERNAAVSNTLVHLFDKPDVKPDADLMKKVKKNLQPSRSGFCSMEYNWYSFVPVLWRLQRFYEANKVKNFTLIPQFAYGRKAIRIDTQTMARMADAVMQKGDANKNGKTTFYTRIWSPFINYQKFQTRNHHFDYSLITDGASFSVLHFVRERNRKKI